MKAKNMTATTQNVQWVAFAGQRRVAFGQPRTVASTVKAVVTQNPEAQVLVFDVLTSETVEIDLRGSVAEVLARLPVEAETVTPVAEAAAEVTPAAPRLPGRPKLGVVAREVTLLPRHWEWLSAQSGGASVALRKLVEQSLRDNAEADRRRAAQESVYRFLNAIAGNLPGFEEATRALFAGDVVRFANEMTNWPPDVREHALFIVQGAPA